MVDINSFVDAYLHDKHFSTAPSMPDGYDATDHCDDFDIQPCVWYKKYIPKGENE